MPRTSSIRESRKIEQLYAKSLLTRASWLEKVQDQIIKELKKQESEYQVDTVSSDIKALLNKLKTMYKDRFTLKSTKLLAKRLFEKVSNHNANRLKSAFNVLGIDLGEALSREDLSDFAGISIQNNVNLISSISDDYFDKIEGIVYNGMMAGKNYDDMAEQIMQATGSTKKRAKFIARDQTSSINAQLSKIRANKAGIKKAYWIKTKPRKTKDYTPRESHVKADGKTFDLDKGLLVDGEYIIPGEKIACTCAMGFVLE